MESVLDRLKKYDRKYYFHGSSVKNIVQLEPHYSPNFAFNDEFTNESAVYATDNYQEACIYALMNLNLVPANLKVSKSFQVEPDEIGYTINMPAEWKDYLCSNSGYIYVVPTEPFTHKKGSNIKSLKKVRVIDTVEVTFKDFANMGGRINYF